MTHVKNLFRNERSFFRTKELVAENADVMRRLTKERRLDRYLGPALHKDVLRNFQDATSIDVSPSEAEYLIRFAHRFRPIEGWSWDARMTRFRDESVRHQSVEDDVRRVQLCFIELELWTNV